ncbi:MAG: hypothetical protein HYX60_11180, partial [Legionella longbeachae]|nr:hypothetical protein [Legionella longbeachae]
MKLIGNHMRSKIQAKTPNWHQMGSFDIDIITRQGEYLLNDCKSDIYHICLDHSRRHSSDKNVRMQIRFSSREKAVSFHEKFNNHPIYKKICYSDGVYVFPDFTSNKLCIGTDIKEDFIVVLREIAKFEPNTRAILPDLCEDLKISNLYTLSELEEMKIEEAINLAKDAQAIEFYELIWQLANIYY